MLEWNSKATAVVTGGEGFVGRHLVDALAARGCSVRSADVSPGVARDGVVPHQVDLRDASAAEALVRGADVVFHCASVVQTRNRGASDVMAVNVGGTDHVIDACRRASVPRLVYVSSASVVYEGRDIEAGDESLPYASRPPAVYAASKIEAERRVLLANSADFRTTAIRPHVIFGPGDTRFLPAILQRARAGKLKAAVGLRDKRSDFTYIDNLVDAMLAAGERVESAGVAGEAFFVTNGEPMAFFDFVGRVLARSGLPPIRGRVPFWLAYSVAAAAEGVDRLKGGDVPPEDGLTRFAVRYLCTHHWFRIDKARRALGYEPRVSVREGIERTIPHAHQAAS